MRNKMKKKSLHEFNENEFDLPLKYKKTNLEFKKMMKNIPDFSKMEPMEIYMWVEKLANLTKI